jgi:acyl carrier protein
MIKKIISEVLSISEDQIVPELKLVDIEDWDSMNHMILITEIEDKMGIDFTGDEIADMNTIKDLLEIVKNK